MIGLLCFFLLFRFESLSAGLQMVLGILAPFVYGAVIAYILTPVCDIVNAVEKEYSSFSTGGPVARRRARHACASYEVRRSQPHPRLSAPRSSTALKRIHGILFNCADYNGSGSQLAVFFGVVKDPFLGILISIYFLASRKQFAAQGKLLLNGIFSHRWADPIEEEARYADRMFNGFLMEKLLDSAIIGVICFAWTALMEFGSAAPISVIVGVPLFAVIYDVVRKLAFFGLNEHGCGELLEEYNSAFHPEPAEKK